MTRLHEAEAFRVGSDFGWHCLTCTAEETGYPSSEEPERLAREHELRPMSPLMCLHELLDDALRDLLEHAPDRRQEIEAFCARYGSSIATDW